MFLKLVNAGKDKVQLVQILREYTGYSLSECKKIAETEGIIFELNKTESFLYKLQIELISLGAKIELVNNKFEINQNYLKKSSGESPVYTINLLQKGRSEYETVSIIRKYTNLSMDDAITIVNSAPIKFHVELSSEKTNELIEKLEAISAKATIVPAEIDENNIEEDYQVKEPEIQDESEKIIQEQERPKDSRPKSA